MSWKIFTLLFVLAVFAICALTVILLVRIIMFPAVGVLIFRELGFSTGSSEADFAIAEILLFVIELGAGISLLACYNNKKKRFLVLGVPFYLALFLEWFLGGPAIVEAAANSLGYSVHFLGAAFILGCIVVLYGVTGMLIGMVLENEGWLFVTPDSLLIVLHQPEPPAVRPKEHKTDDLFN